jgi:Xaa-Pro aminopeptidase
MLRTICVVLLLAQFGLPAGPGLFQSDFPAAEFQARRARVFERIGNAVAVIQGASAAEGFQPFRQSNDFYYLCGVETPHAYLLLDGRTRHSVLYLPHRDPATERQGNKLLTAEDAEEVAKLTGVDAVYGVEELARSLGAMQIKTPPPPLYVPHSPQQGIGGSRDELLHQVALIASDPWDGRPPRQAWFLHLLRDRFPSFELRDLSPILDDLRLIKSEREIALIRRASQIAGWGILEAMRCTRVGVYEYQLDAAARFVFLEHGARYDAYPSITAGGKNAWMGHYFRKTDQLKDGDLVLMDYAPDYRYYASDVTRMWPVNGKYDTDQRALCDFILAYRNALLRRIKPGVTPDRVMDDARVEMAEVAARLHLSKECYRAAVQKMLDFRGHLSHPVGMTVHDVSSYRDAPLRAGLVFSIDPMLWVPEEELYVRMEDTVTVTSAGVENFTDFLAARPDDIEKILRERGLVQLRPPEF